MVKARKERIMYHLGIHAHCHRCGLRESISAAVADTRLGLFPLLLPVNTANTSVTLPASHNCPIDWRTCTDPSTCHSHPTHPLHLLQPACPMRLKMCDVCRTHDCVQNGEERGQGCKRIMGEAGTISLPVTANVSQDGNVGVSPSTGADGPPSNHLDSLNDSK